MNFYNNGSTTQWNLETRVHVTKTEPICKHRLQIPRTAKQKVSL